MRLKKFACWLGCLVLTLLPMESRGSFFAQAGQEIRQGVDAAEDATTHAVKTTGHVMKKGAKKTAQAMGSAGHAVKGGSMKTASLAKNETTMAGEKTVDAGRTAGRAVKEGTVTAGEKTADAGTATGHA